MPKFLNTFRREVGSYDLKCVCLVVCVCGVSLIIFTPQIMKVQQQNIIDLKKELASLL